MERVSSLSRALATAIVALGTSATLAQPKPLAATPGSAPFGKFARSTTLDVSILGSEGRSVDFQASTDAFGGLQFGYVPWNEFTARKPYASGTLALPDPAFGTVRARGTDDWGLRATFAVRGGKFVDPGRYLHDVFSPFSLFCRSDEGPPATLDTGTRFAFEVPGGAAELKAVLDLPYIHQPHVFRLPGDRGHGVSSAAGADPKATSALLEGLFKEKRIGGLERDPCYLFLPEGKTGAEACSVGERPFPDKAVQLEGSFTASLRERYLKSAIGNGYVLYNPIVPTPFFFDPGDRVGDELPPTFVRSGADGNYQVSLGGLSGAIEISAAKECDEHTTTAIVKRPGPQYGPGTGAVVPVTLAPPTVARPPKETPQKPAASAPREKPGPNQAICGPDVTDYILGSLQQMEDSYKGWSPTERKARCDALFGFTSFAAAWDMASLSPGNTNDTSNPDLKPGAPGWMEHVFFQRAAPGYCAVPARCANTAEFLGRCVHVQELNYVQWGMVNELCQTQTWGTAAQEMRAMWHRSLFWRQYGFAQLGEYFGAYNSTSMQHRKDVMKRLLDFFISEHRAEWDAMEGFDCATTCDKFAPDASQWLDNADWGFQWGIGFSQLPVSIKGSDLKKP